jgi:hypothetical protein
MKINLPADSTLALNPRNWPASLTLQYSAKAPLISGQLIWTVENPNALNKPGNLIVRAQLSARIPFRPKFEFSAVSETPVMAGEVLPELGHFSEYLEVQGSSKKRWVKTRDGVTYFASNESSIHIEFSELLNGVFNYTNLPLALDSAFLNDDRSVGFSWLMGGRKIYLLRIAKNGRKEKPIPAFGSAPRELLFLKIRYLVCQGQADQGEMNWSDAPEVEVGVDLEESVLAIASFKIPVVGRLQIELQSFASASGSVAGPTSGSAPS